MGKLLRSEDIEKELNFECLRHYGDPSHLHETIDALHRLSQAERHMYWMGVQKDDLEMLMLYMPLINSLKEMLDTMIRYKDR